MLEKISGISTKTISIIAYTDSNSFIEAVCWTKLVYDKRLRVDIAAISQSLARNEVSEIKWRPGKAYLADCMTKHGASWYSLLNVLKDGKMPEDYF